jgi:hypothetical protein
VNVKIYFISDGNGSNSRTISAVTTKASNAVESFPKSHTNG